MLSINKNIVSFEHSESQNGNKIHLSKYLNSNLIKNSNNYKNLESIEKTDIKLKQVQNRAIFNKIKELELEQKFNEFQQ